MLNSYESKIFDNLTKIASGGSREVLIRDKENLRLSKSVVKAQPLNKFVADVDIDCPDIQAKKAEFLASFIKRQKELVEIFGDMYVPARFPRILVKNGQCYFISHERYSPKIYPSEIHLNVTNLTFLGYFGLDAGNLDERNRDFILGALLQNQDKNYIQNYQRLGINSLIQGLAFFKAKIAVAEYLQVVEKYANMGYRLDLVGKDNVVLHKKNQNFRIIINNSAAKIKGIDTFAENLEKISSNRAGSEEILEFFDQVAMMVNVNLLCDLINRPRIFSFSSNAESQIIKILENWESYCIPRKI